MFACSERFISGNGGAVRRVGVELWMGIDRSVEAEERARSHAFMFYWKFCAKSVYRSVLVQRKPSVSGKVSL